MGSAEGLSPFAGSLRVSLRYNFFPFLTRKGARAMSKESFSGQERTDGMETDVTSRGVRFASDEGIGWRTYGCFSAKKGMPARRLRNT